MTTPRQHAELAAQQSVTDALRRAFYLGQTYWQQADSEYTSQHRKADATRAKFHELCERTEDAIDTLLTQLAEAQRRIKELETPTMFWDFNNPEHGAFDSPYYAICEGDFDEGAEVSFVTARALPTKTVRVTRDSEGNYGYEYIDAAKGEKNGA